MVSLQRISKRLDWARCVVAASGPSLTEAVAAQCRGQRVIAVNDSGWRLPFADVLYVGDRDLIELRHGYPDFAGEKWTAHEPYLNDKRTIAAAYPEWHFVAGPRNIDQPGFSLNPDRLHYGNCSGFQAINLAILFGARRIVLVGFDMRTPADGQPRHWHADYELPAMNLAKYEHFHQAFHVAARGLPPDIQIINATPHSALRCFPMLELGRALGQAIPA